MAAAAAVAGAVAADSVPARHAQQANPAVVKASQQDGVAVAAVATGHAGSLQPETGSSRG